MRSGGMEAVLIGGVGQGDLLAVRSPEGESTFSCHSWALRAGGARGSALMRRYSRWGVVAERYE